MTKILNKEKIKNYIHWEIKLGIIRISWFNYKLHKFTFRFEISKGWG